MVGEISQNWLTMVRANVGQPPGTQSATPDERFYGWMSDAQNDLANRLDDSDLPTLMVDETIHPGVAKQVSFALPSDHLGGRHRGLVYNGRLALWFDVEDEQILRDNTILTPSKGSPKWNIYGDAINLFIGADFTATTDTIIFRYIKAPVDMSATVDPSVPLNMRPLVVWFSCARFYDERQDIARASYYSQQYEVRVQEYVGRSVDQQTRQANKAGDSPISLSARGRR
jgi:hypothetical protein